MDGNFDTFNFTNNWFSSAALSNWESLIPQVKPRKILEVGSYEGASASYLIGKNTWHDDAELFCIDTWEQDASHGAYNVDMESVEKRFDHNIEVAKSLSAKNCEVTKLKGFSSEFLPKLLAEGHEGTFDFIYIDGSHHSPEVMLDAVLAFRLCRVGGVIAFDDYLWTEQQLEDHDPILTPKLAIDAFTNTYSRKIKIVPAPLYQLYVTKLAA